MIERAKHCELCDNNYVDFNTGTACRLTNRKPSFHKKCFDITLNQKYEDVIRRINIEHHNVKTTKIDSLINTLVFSGLGLVGIVIALYFSIASWDYGFISTVPIVIMGAGVSVLSIGIGSFKKYKQAITVADKNKKELDDLLLQYNINYSIEVSGKYGLWETKLELKKRRYR